MSCCSGKGCDEFFTDRVARRDARRYRSKGLDRNAQRLVDTVCQRGVEGSTVLEVGGGIGAIQLELLKAGAARTREHRTLVRLRTVRRGASPRCRTRRPGRAATVGFRRHGRTGRICGCRRSAQGRVLLPRLRSARWSCRDSRQTAARAHLPTEVMVDAARIHCRQPARAPPPEDVPSLRASTSGNHRVAQRTALSQPPSTEGRCGSSAASNESEPRRRNGLAGWPRLVEGDVASFTGLSRCAPRHDRSTLRAAEDRFVVTSPRPTRRPVLSLARPGATTARAGARAMEGWPGGAEAVCVRPLVWDLDVLSLAPRSMGTSSTLASSAGHGHDRRLRDLAALVPASSERVTP